MVWDVPPWWAFFGKEGLYFLHSTIKYKSIHPYINTDIN